VWRTAAHPRDIEEAEDLAAMALASAATRREAARSLRLQSGVAAGLLETALRLVSRAGPLSERSNANNWQVVRERGHPRARYARAVESQRLVCADYPLYSAYLNTLGVGLLRLGEYEEALAVLERADELNRPPARRNHPASDRAYIALCLFELGQRGRARAMIEELRDQIDEPGFSMQAFEEAADRLSR
jgi:tetratricopeptide (TPR) repeat protein